MAECPCDSGFAYSACCGPLHDGVRNAATPEELMRSRYSAFAKGLPDYLFRTWHPRTRPSDVSLDSQVRWTGLKVLEATGDEVEFVAHYAGREGPEALHERSRFEQRAGRWFYVEDIG